MICESRLLLALFNGAWQSGIVCALAYFALLSTRRLNATNIHGVWNVLLCVSIALPVANYSFTKPAVVARVAVSSMRSSGPSPGSGPSFDRLTMTRGQSTMPHRQSATRPDVGAMWFNAELWTLRNARGFLALMAALASFKIGLLVKDLIVMLRLRRRVTPIEAPVDVPLHGLRVPRFAVTQELQTPCVLGFAKPLIVLPHALVEDGNPGQLRDVVAHEAAHVKRWDDVQNFIHRAIAAVLFFDPGVMLALHELAIARESACDDAVLEARQDRIAYATTLSGMALWARRHSIAVPSLIVGKKQLVRRIEQLLDRRRDHTVAHDRPLTVGALVVVGVAAFALVHYQLPAVAQKMESVVQKSLGEKPLKALLQEPALRIEPPKTVAVVKAKVTAPRITAPRLTKETRVTTQTKTDVAIAPPSPPAAHKTDLLDALDTGGYRNLSANQLVALSNHGVGSCLIEQSGKSFTQRPSIDDLIAMADKGVSCSYLRALVAAGLQSLEPQQVIELAQQGVSMSYAAAVRTYVRNATIADITRLAQHGVSSSLIGGISQRKYAASGDQLVRLADHGVSLQYIDSVNRGRSSPFTLDDIVRLHDSGFSPSNSHT